MNELGDAAEGAHIPSKDIEFSLRPGNCNRLEPQEMLIPSEGEISRTRQFTDIRDGKRVIRSVSFADASDPPSASHRLMDDPGVMVQELTVRNCNGGSLAIVGTSNNKDNMQPRQSHWQRIYPLMGESGSGSSFVNTAFGDRGEAVSTAHEDAGDMAFTDFLAQNLPSDDLNETIEQLTNTENKEVAANDVSHGGIRTKILSKSGFAKFFVKSTLKGKGVICRAPPQEVHHAQLKGQNNSMSTDGTAVASSVAPILCTKTAIPSLSGIAEPRTHASDHDGITMREWLKVGSRKVNKMESLYIFRQVLDLVDCSHAQGITLYDIRPSRFKLLPSNQVRFLGSPAQKEMIESVMDLDTSHTGHHMIRKRTMEEEVSRSMGFCDKKQRFGENPNIARRWPLFSSRSGLRQGTYYDGNINDPQDSLREFSGHNRGMEYGAQYQPRSAPMPNTVQQLTCLSNQLEDTWYRSPEELSGRGGLMSSNIYSLGVLLFELLGHFVSEREHSAAMLDLRNRILPPNFLSENLKEAGFCLWLLHPEPSSRPTTREILQSGVVNGQHEVCTEDLSSSIDQAEAESELLLHFLTTLQEQKQKHAFKLAAVLRCLESDIEEVERRRSSKYPSATYSLQNDKMLFHEPSSSELPSKEPSSSELPSRLSHVQNINESKLMQNINQLESAYFSMRSRIQPHESDATKRLDKDLLRNCDSWHPAQRDEEHYSDPLGTFFDGVCKYARYSKFKVRGVLRNGDFNNSANVICSLSFDRDRDYFAAAGVSKKIKIFEFNALLNDSVDIHYPVIEMSNKSRLSCVSWNSYIRNYLASTDYDGIVKLWDASTGQGFSQYIEHQKRAWSVDFSQVDPTKFASGSDDCAVKLWSINEKNCLGTIQNIANVCCVQFSPHSSNLLAFGSADYRTYCYDLRNVKTPWCVLTGHDKAVSYVKFLDSETLVSASTDNTLKIWDLNRTNPTDPSTDACSLTLGGHTNEKNFVGLSVADGYIACGSETNEVYAYHRSLPMPMTCHKFGSIDPISGKDTDDDNGQFVSSVCWREKSDMVIAANSTGCIKVMEMV